MSCNVYKITYAFDNGGRHYALFVETHPPYGSILHVQGTLQTGMEHVVKSDMIPTQQAFFLSRQHVGTVKTAQISGLMRVFRCIPPPGKQLDDQGQKINEYAPFYGSEEWCDDLISALEDISVLENAG